jgi:hypothetical protein
MTRPPEFDDLVGGDVPAEERARLEHVHELLVAAGPPPELPPSLAHPPEQESRIARLVPRRRLGAALALAAAIALVAFLGGYLAGYSRHGFTAQYSRSMHGTAAAPNASATIDVGNRDAAGNWPLRVVVRGLKPLPHGSFYEMYLTQGVHKYTCGTFTVQGTTTTVRLNAPYRLRRGDGWIVRAEHVNERQAAPVVLST